ncbi:NAD(P)-binding domain-containing protein [Marinivivus vitaminiproducens]|uniref:NAD(P)-binding domain-containing protein n=1 Tax=Marinivivus vitaminiproducens TaxID=3035935 RepID=UPI0027AAFB51|nr:NAD(P)/FAD-dependent oxidoreductase [Geminicoccaceae bacterium SCSIO 64248]
MAKAETQAPDGVDVLRERLHYDLDCLELPAKSWVPARSVDGEHVHDVVIVGGGMCGLAAFTALRWGGMHNIRILDRNPAGREGPWLNYARMETLRSPKQLSGPALGIGALTFRAWFSAQFGEAAWAALDRIPRAMWMDYLTWYRSVLGIPVENEVAVSSILPEGRHLRLALTGEGACEHSLLTRKVVMATGRDGLGTPAIPSFVKALPRSRWAHSSDDIDFAALRGKRVVVVGIGASAVDNAAEALEAGASEVRLLIRRKTMPTINKMMGIGSFGFVNGFPDLSDAWRWRFMHCSFLTQTPAPRGSTLRVSRHANAYFHFGKTIARVRETNGAIRIEMQDGTQLAADFLILGTGFTIDPLARAEMPGYAGEVLLWRDRYAPPSDEQNHELGMFPYLNADFSFQERIPGKAPWLGQIHCFNYGATVSLGKVSGDIPGISEGAQWLARSVAARLYAEDIDRHWQGMLDYAKPELLGDEWTASEIGEAITDTAAGGTVFGGIDAQ